MSLAVVKTRWAKLTGSLVVLVLSTVLLAACGSAATPTPIPPTPTAAPTATPVPVATLTASPQTTSLAPCSTKGVTQLTAAGATFPYPLYSTMFAAYAAICKVQVNYQSIGSGGGISALQGQTVDFAGSDAIMNDQQRQQAKGGPVLHIPTVAGAEAVLVNLPGIQRSQLKLTPDVLANIYLKNIKKWNDPAIAAINPGLQLPNLDIAVVHRSDGSGTTFIFTSYLSKVSSDWSTKVGNATSVNWPGDIGGTGNDGVAGQVKQISGAIGYVELAYALQNNLAWAQVQNEAGIFLDPSLDGASQAANVATLPDNMEVLITNSDNPKAYPITGFTWLLIYQNQTDPAKADAVVHLAWWMTHDAQSFATPLEYAPLKPAAIVKDEALIKKINVNGQPVLP